MIRAIANAGTNALQNTVLIAINIGVAGTVIGLTTLKLMEHFEESPEIKSLSCFVGILNEDCPQYGQSLRDARAKTAEAVAAEKEARDIISRVQAELDAINASKTDAEERIQEWKALEARYSDTNFFAKYTDPHSNLMVHVGTIYESLVNPSPNPEYFCYIVLGSDSSGATRNLWLRNDNKDIQVSRRTLRANNLNQKTVDFGHSVCKPLLFGQVD